jgi:hypothetical protein
VLVRCNEGRAQSAESALRDAGAHDVEVHRGGAEHR